MLQHIFQLPQVKSSQIIITRSRMYDLPYGCQTTWYLRFYEMKKSHENHKTECERSLVTGACSKKNLAIAQDEWKFRLLNVPSKFYFTWFCQLVSTYFLKDCRILQSIEINGNIGTKWIKKRVRCSIYIPLEISIPPVPFKYPTLVFWPFLGVYKWNIGLKCVNVQKL